MKNVQIKKAFANQVVRTIITNHGSIKKGLIVETVQLEMSRRYKMALQETTIQRGLNYLFKHGYIALAPGEVVLTEKTKAMLPFSLTEAPTCDGCGEPLSPAEKQMNACRSCMEDVRYA